MLKKYFNNLFSADTSDVVVVSTPNKSAEIKSSFEACGFNMKSIALNDITLDGF